jgi:pimeloyl-ACP methyl ester carboxylesterase
MNMQVRQLDVPVDGGDLRVLLWGTGRRVAVAVHGMTGSGMAWQAVARQMPAGWTLAAPDLRGRGKSCYLPGPYGLEQHAADVTAVLRHFGGRPVLVGHSMGAYVALLTRDAHPKLVRRLVLIDGGLPLPVPEGADPDAVLDATLGPAIARLRQTFPDTEAYLDFWREHPALSDNWTADVEAYCRYDLTGEPGGLRPRAAEDAVSTDGREVLGEKVFADALSRLTEPTPLLCAPAGMFGEPPGLLPPEVIAAWQERVPQLRPQVVPDVNHYTIVFDKQGAAAVARAITTTAA